MDASFFEGKFNAMIFNCKKLELSEAIVNVSKAVPSKSSIPQLEGIKVLLNGNMLTLTGYNLELGITTSVLVENASSNGEADQDGYIINARIFSEMIKKMPSDDINVSINLNGSMKAKIKAGSTNCNIAVLSAKDYPELPNTSNGDTVVVSQSTLKSMISETIYAVSTNDVKPILTGELFDIDHNSFNLVAIDGKRLAIRHEAISYGDTLSFVVPAKTLAEISHLLKDDATADCKIVSAIRHIMFQIGKYTIISRLLEGEFHNYKGSIPTENNTEAIVKVKELTECLDRCSLLINEKNRAPVKLKFGDNSLKITCETPLGNIDETINVKTTQSQSQELVIGLNNKFLLDALKASNTDQVKILMNSPIKPVLLVPMQSDSFTFLLMPIQIRENR